MRLKMCPLLTHRHEEHCCTFPTRLDSFPGQDEADRFRNPHQLWLAGYCSSLRFLTFDSVLVRRTRSPPYDDSLELAGSNRYRRSADNSFAEKTPVPAGPFL